MTTDLDPSALRALLAAATPGPWKPCGARDDACDCGLVWSGDGAVVVARTTQDDSDDVRLDNAWVRANAHLIAAAVNALGPLLDALAAAEGATSSPREAPMPVDWTSPEGLAELEAWRATHAALLEAMSAVWETPGVTIGQVQARRLALAGEDATHAAILAWEATPALVAEARRLREREERLVGLLREAAGIVGLSSADRLWERIIAAIAEVPHADRS